MNDDKGLVERLNRSTKDTTAFCPEPTYRNPDGPEAAARIQVLSDRIAVLTGHVTALVGLIEANSMPLSREEYRYVKAAHDALTPQESSSNAE